MVAQDSERTKSGWHGVPSCVPSAAKRRSNGRRRGAGFSGSVSQGFDLAGPRAMSASALEEMAESYLEEGLPLPTRSAAATDPEADYVELISLSVAAGAVRPTHTQR